MIYGSWLASTVTKSWCTSVFLNTLALVKQVCNLLHVNFQKRNGHSERALYRILFNVIENMIDTTRHQSTLKHRLAGALIKSLQITIRRFTSKYRMGLTRASLSIRHYYSIKSIKYILHNWLCNHLIRFRLRWITCQDLIEKEISLVVLLSYQWYFLPGHLINF